MTRLERRRVSSLATYHRYRDRYVVKKRSYTLANREAKRLADQLRISIPTARAVLAAMDGTYEPPHV